MGNQCTTQLGDQRGAGCGSKEAQVILRCPPPQQTHRPPKSGNKRTHPDFVTFSSGTQREEIRGLSSGSVFSTQLVSKGGEFPVKARTLNTKTRA